MGLSIRYIFIKIYFRGEIMIRITLESALNNYNISRYELAKRTGIRYHIIDNYYKNKVVRYDSFVLNKICVALDCKIEDIITFEKE